jgi:hypothetical protein
MTKFHEADRYLIDHWAEAREFEEGMKELRTKDDAILNKVQEELKAEVWWTPDAFHSWSSANYGQVGFTKKSWNRGGGERDFPGFWLDHLLLDHLVGTEDARSRAYLWLGRLRKSGVDLESTKRDILSGSTKILKTFPPRSGENIERVICYEFPEKREELVKGLLSEGSKPFIKILVGHANRLADLIPVVDGVLGNGEK